MCGVSTFSADKIVPSSCDEARNLAFHGVPPRIPFHDFHLWQWDEDGDGGQDRGPWEGWDAQTQASFLNYHPPPHPRQPRPVSPPPFTANNLVLPGFLQLLLAATTKPLQSVLHKPFKNTNLVTSSHPKKSYNSFCGLRG